MPKNHHADTAKSIKEAEDKYITDRLDAIESRLEDIYSIVDQLNSKN